MADKKSRQIIRQAKQNNPNAIVVATGCYAQVSKEELEKIEGLNIIIGNTEKSNIVEIIEKYHKKHIQVGKIEEEKEFKDFGTITYTEKTRAVIKVQDGCNNFCSYCIIPYARGRIRSRSMDSVLAEVKEIVKKGIKEIVITGIHIASYGKDFENGIRLIDLLEKLNNIEGLKRIRLGSLEPNLITEEFVNRLSNVDKICDHFHLSLQSGCNETLKRMNRKYTTANITEIIERLRNYYKDVIITTDIIVGFPGETEEEFNKTYEFLKQIKFYKMHIFPYSIRKGTKAAEMPNQVESQEKETRSKKLIELSNQNQLDYNQKYINQIVEVLIEEDSKGHTANYILVKVAGVQDVENKLIKVGINSAEEEFLKGTLKSIEN